MPLEEEFGGQKYGENLGSTFYYRKSISLDKSDLKVCLKVNILLLGHLVWVRTLSPHDLVHLIRIMRIDLIRKQLHTNHGYPPNVSSKCFRQMLNRAPVGNTSVRLRRGRYPRHRSHAGF